DAPEGTILLLHNLADVAVTVDLRSVAVSEAPSEVLADADYGPLATKLTELDLHGWGYRWIRLRRGNRG
ncbi:MAG: maltose alpha-D-glucosyltransferase / alpha-amylase, partial [Pseudonocardiales bacterium]|nr:maltose alpha-D-glucosyltransferase / alpha-amylase [Pseudonocardiales bacterium]